MALKGDLENRPRAPKTKSIDQRSLELLAEQRASIVCPLPSPTCSAARPAPRDPNDVGRARLKLVGGPPACF